MIPGSVSILLLGMHLSLGLQVTSAVPARPIVVGSKPFGESYLLAEMFAQLLEARGFEVRRRLGLGATEIAFQALRTNGIDVYPEYTGTGLVAVLGERPSSDPRQVYRQVSREFRRRYGARWLPPLGFAPVSGLRQIPYRRNRRSSRETPGEAG